MLSIANLIRRIKSTYNYNVGFVEISPDEFVSQKGFGDRKVEWMRHGYNDRWFADPFILNADDECIIVLAEEKKYGHPGSLVRLKVSRFGKKLIERVALLELSTHLSYPIPIEIDGNVFIYPENSQSGRLNIYQYNNGEVLKNAKNLIDEPLNDSTIYFDRKKDCFYLIATHTDIDPHDNALLFKSHKLTGPWSEVYKSPIISDKRFARPGGNFFVAGNKLYRPAQDCVGSYGNSLHIMQVDSFEPWKESEVFHLVPSSFKYSEGLHTLNFHSSGVAVIDGNGYAYPIIGRLFGPLLEKIIHPSK